jgi:predicted nucleic-acid-binding protein
MRRIVVDTNVFVRALVKEASEHGRIAEALLSSATLVVTPTVLLEGEWVMRGIMKISRQTINQLLSAALEIGAFEFEQHASVTVAVRAHAAGMDFADALHVSLTAAGETFLTFDKGLVKLAQKHINSVSVELAS